jgi:hypothetical protein
MGNRFRVYDGALRQAANVSKGAGMSDFNRAQRQALLREQAGAYVDVALTNMLAEYPHMPYFIAIGPESYRTHRELHPAFFGSFDWHSCVEMHWLVVRLLRRFPGLAQEGKARATLDALLTPAHMATEAAFFTDPNHKTLERPYGWGWLLALNHELHTWDDPDAQRWAAALAPLATVLIDHLLAWLPRLTYPQRIGMHANTAFGLSRSWEAAGLLRPELREAIVEAATRWFAADTAYPAHYEPSGADFLSAALCEAELMAKVLPGEAFAPWLDAFLPGIPASEPTSLFTPAIVSDETDGQIAHLHGLNLSRAWAFVRLADALPANDARRGLLREAAERHADASLEAVVGSDFAVEHWLAAYATLLLSE